MTTLISTPARPATAAIERTSAAASAAAGTRLSTDRVGLTYRSSRGDVPAIGEVSLAVAPGEFVSVLGPSGCGKSTLIRLIAGLIVPTRGEIAIGDAPVRGPSRAVGVVFQQPALLPWRTILANVLLPVRTLGLDRNTFKARAQSLLDLVGIGEFSGHYPHELSGGMRQRAGIARGLVHDPAILLMDEPFAALDAFTRERMMVELRRIWQATGKSIVFITHSIAEAVYLSDRVVLLSGRPSRVAEEVSVDLPAAREIGILETPAFNRIASHLRASLNALSTGDDER